MGDEPWGHFEGSLNLRVHPPPGKRLWWEWLFPRRPQVTVLSKFVFVEPDGTRWISSGGDVVNGLSSPWCLWRLMPPFAWRGVRASALHDSACVNRIRPSWRTHRMMYRAMRCDNESPLRAWVTWKLIRFFGPRFFGKGVQ